MNVIYQAENFTPFVIKEKKIGAIDYIEIENVRGFSVAKTFDCGQCFRFERVENSCHEVEFSGVAFGRFLSFGQDEDILTIYNCTRDFFEEKLYAYLGLCDDYEAIRQNILSRCPMEYMISVSKYGEGIRILRQERWETLCSFIISQNNNIPRIKKIIASLSERCGERIETAGMCEHGAGEFEYSFPTPEKVASLGIDGLRELKVGFRAAYILDAATKVASGELDLREIAEMPFDECVESLMKIKGVGMKVASCTALFCMEKFDAFPIDVWIRKVLDEKFPKNFDPASLGKYAGIAQQYMFYGARGFTENII